MTYTPEQRIAASKAVYALKFGNTEADQFEHEHWAKKKDGSDVAVMIDLQCHVNALREALRFVKDTYYDEMSRTDLKHTQKVLEQTAPKESHQ
jgi:hypothetical protein